MTNLLDTTDAEIAAVINSAARYGQNPLAGHSGPAGNCFPVNWPGHSGSLLFWPSGEWLKLPNPAFDGSTPLQVTERGEIDRIWRMIWELQAGNTG